MDRDSAELVIVRGDADIARWAGAERAFIGFPDNEAAELSAPHTRNFM
jgi:hypothetical protein